MRRSTPLHTSSTKVPGLSCTWHRLPALLALVALASLPLSCKKSEAQADDAASALQLDDHHHVEPLPPSPIRLVYLEGELELVRGGTGLPIEIGDSLEAGDIVRTAALSSAEFAVGDAGSIRILPETEWMVRSLVAGADSRLLSGGVLVKLRKLLDGERFVIETGDAVMGVRGTSFLVRSSPTPEGRAATQLAVEDGAVALLEKSPLLTGLVEGSSQSAKARAVVDYALSIAPHAAAGEEITVSIPADDGAPESMEALSELLIAAEELRLDWSLVEDPAAELRAVIDESRREELRARLARAASVPVSGENRRLLELLDHVREPGAQDWTIPAALPMERFAPPPASKAKEPVKEAPPPSRDPAIDWMNKVSKAPIIDPLTRAGDIIIARSADGQVHAIDEKGSLLWTDTVGSDSVTALDDRVALVKSGTIRILDAKTGTEKGGWSAELATPDAPVRAASGDDFAAPIANSKPVPVPDGVAMVTPRGIAIVRSENAALVREILVPEGFYSSPILAGRELVAVSAKGELLVMDPAAGQVQARIPLAIDGPCLLPRWAAPRLFVASRSGKVLAIDLVSRTTIWERDLGQGLDGDLEFGDDRLFLHGVGGTLIILDAQSGGDAVAALKGVGSPPLLSAGVLWYGTDDGFVIALDARSLKTLKTIDVGERISVRPIMIGNRLYAGTRSGKIIRINTALRP